MALKVKLCPYLSPSIRKNSKWMKDVVYNLRLWERGRFPHNGSVGRAVREKTGKFDC